jgi:hypothetical protein
MRRLAGSVLCVSLLAGCASTAPRSYPVPESRRLEAELDLAWEAAVRVLADRGYEIQRNDRTAGVIETNWLRINNDYTAGAFLTQNEDRYGDCGKPGLWTTFRGKQARVILRLAPVGRGQTEVVIVTAFRTEHTSIWWESSEVRECRSRGRLEEEILIETQVRALTNQIQRSRRGWQ